MDNTQNNMNNKMKITLIVIVAVLVLSIILIIVFTNLPKEITYLEFETLDDENISFSYFFGSGKTFTGKILTDGRKFDESEIEIIADNPSIANIELGDKGKDYIKYSVTSKYNGTVNIYAQTKDGKVRTSNKKFIISGGKDKPLTTEENNIKLIKETIKITEEQATDIAKIIKRVGFDAIDTIVYDSSKGSIDTYAFSIENGLAINIEMQNEELKRIYVLGYNKTLLLYDSEQNGIVHVITDAEISSYKTQQDNVYNKYLRELVNSIIQVKVTKNANKKTIKATVKNLSDKQMKYVYITVTPYNNVGDQVDVSGVLTIIGPISHNGTATEECSYSSWPSTATKWKFTGLEIVFMDGTEMEFTQEMINMLD